MSEIYLNYSMLFYHDLVDFRQILNRKSHVKPTIHILFWIETIKFILWNIYLTNTSREYLYSSLLIYQERISFQHQYLKKKCAYKISNYFREPCSQDSSFYELFLIKKRDTWHTIRLLLYSWWVTIRIIS